MKKTDGGKKPQTFSCPHFFIKKKKKEKNKLQTQVIISVKPCLQCQYISKLNLEGQASKIKA